MASQQVDPGADPGDEGGPYTKSKAMIEKERKEQRAASRAAASNENNYAGTSRAHPKDVPRATPKQAGRPDASGTAAKAAPKVRTAGGGTNGQPARNEKTSQLRALGQSGHASRFAPKRITIRLPGDEDSTKVICATTEGRVILQLGARVTREVLGADYNQLKKEDIVSALKASLQTLGEDLSLPDPVVSYVPFTANVAGVNQPVAKGAYMGQLTVPARTAAAIRAALYSTGRVPSVDVPISGGRHLRMTLARPGNSPVDTAFDAARMPRLIRVEARDEASVFTVAEMLRGMLALGMITGVGWVGSAAANGGGTGTARAFPEGKLATASELYAALKEQQAVPLQLPAGVPAPEPGTFLALVWGMNKELLQAHTATMEMPLCASAAPAGSSLLGRAEVPLTLSHVQLDARPASRPSLKVDAGQSTYAGVLGGSQAVVQSAEEKEAAVDAAAEETARVLCELHVLQKQLAEVTAEAQTSKTQLEEARAMLDVAALSQQRAAATDETSRQLLELQGQLAEARAALEMEQTKLSCQVQLAVEQAEAETAQAQARLKKLMSPIIFLTHDPVQPPTEASTQRMLLDRCTSIILKRVREQRVMAPGNPQGEEETCAVNAAAIAVCNIVWTKWGGNAVARWIRDGKAAPATFTDLALLHFLPKGWVCADLGHLAAGNITSPSPERVPRSSPSPGPAAPTPTAARPGPLPTPVPAEEVQPSTLTGASLGWQLVRHPNGPKLVHHSTEESVSTHMKHNLQLLAQKRLGADVGEAKLQGLAHAGWLALKTGRTHETMKAWLQAGRAPPELTEDRVWALVGVAAPPSPDA